jgi:hypothetical protein
MLLRGCPLLRRTSVQRLNAQVVLRSASKHALSPIQDTDASHRVRWENFMARHGGGRELTRSTEMKQLIRSGVPRNYRTQIWKWLTKYIVGKKYVSTIHSSVYIVVCIEGETLQLMADLSCRGNWGISPTPVNMLLLQ